MEDRSNLTLDHPLTDGTSCRIRSSLGRSQSNMSCDSTGATYKRRGIRYSSACMSAESTPLFTSPASGHGKLTADRHRSGSICGVASPLAGASTMLATNELDRLARRAKESSELRSTPHLAPNGPEVASSPLTKASFVTASIRRRQSQSEGTGSSSLTGTPTGALHFPKKSQRRKASSRQSEIFTPEGIPEVSDENLSSSDSALVFASAVESTSSQPCPRHDSLPCPAIASMSAGNPSTQHDESNASDTIIDPVDQAFERARLTQEQPPKVLQSTAMTRRSKASGLRVEFTNPPVVSSAPDLGLKAPSSLGGTSPPLARAVFSESITPENTRGLWCPPRPRTPAIKRDSMWTHDTASGRKEWSPGHGNSLNKTSSLGPLEARLEAATNAD